MKKWVSPDLKSLGLEKTNGIGCPSCNGGVFASTFSTGGDGAETGGGTGSDHYCHRDKIWHASNCPSLKEGHRKNDPCPSGNNNEWAGISHQSKCCCGSYEGGSSS